MQAGVFIDIDGVVLQGGKPFEWSKQAIHTLWSNEIPFVFVTNGTYSSANLIKILTDILELPFTNDHIVCAPSLCHQLKEYHTKHVLVCCQTDSIDLIKELGFTSYITIDDLIEIFPLLDYVDHARRIELKNRNFPKKNREKIDNFKPIEAILLLGEPIKWESSLQVIIDILMTNGDPRSKFKYVPSPHLPVIACNKDVTFKGAAYLPRFGHGAFLECLESLYFKITKNELEYDHLLGKPYLITYEYAANQIEKLVGKKISKFYVIGDNPEVDIYGANLFKEHLSNLEPVKRLGSSLSLKRLSENDLKSTSKLESILVCTGVYNPQNDLLYHLSKAFDDENNENSVEDDIKFTLDSAEEDNPDSSLVLNEKKRKNSLASNGNIVDLEKDELKKALSRKNSFISYFNNRYNIPDLTVDNLLDAVEHIITDKILNRF